MLTVSQFIADIGVNTHVDDQTSAYADVAKTTAALSYLGLSLIRDHAYDTALPAFRTLAASGIRFDLITDSVRPGDEVAQFAPLSANIVAFEGANEVDLYPVEGAPKQGKVAGAIAEQKVLYAAVKAQSVFQSTPVLNETVGYPTNYAPFAAALAYSDVANLHAYANTGAPNPPIVTALALEPANGKPIALTESGYSTMPGHNESVDQPVQAKYTLDLLFDAAKLGMVNTILYELVDEKPDPNNTDPQLHYGIFNADFSPKPAATAIHDLSTILQSTASTGGSAPTLTPVVTGLPGTGNWMQLTGNGGAQFVVAWAEPQIWNAATETEIAASVSSVTVDLGAAADTVMVYDPLRGTTPIATYGHVSTITIGVTDHPLVIKAYYDAALAPATPTPATPTPATPTPTTPTTQPLQVTMLATPSSTPPPTIAVYRFFDTIHGTHFYSTNPAERDALLATRPDLTYEGVGLTAVDPADPNIAPVYRFFSRDNGTHFFTASPTEHATVDATRPDLVDEGVAFYEHVTPASGDTDVYRFFDKLDGTHFYTGSADERATILTTRPELIDEGIAFYMPAT